MAREPKNRAYKAVPMTNGITSWVSHRMDMTQLSTKSDLEDFVAMIVEPATPQGRLAKMEARLAALGDQQSGHIKRHVDAIRDIHTRVPGVRCGNASRVELRLLDEADQLWKDIMTLREVVPLAEHGKKFPSGKPKGAVGPLRALVRAMLVDRSRSKMSARELWDACKALPDRRRYGIEFYEKDAWVDASGGGGRNVGFARFATIVSEEKKRRR